MRTRVILAVLAAVLTMSAFGAASAAAQTEGDCGLAQLRANTVAASGSFSNAKSLISALTKLDDAIAKVAEG